MMMVKAGPAVDAVIDELLPLLEPGDILIDGGNSPLPGHDPPHEAGRGAGMLYIGTGVSGGEEGALTGPSLMPGGSRRPGRTSSRSSRPIAAKRTPDGDALLRLGRARTAPATT